MDPIDPQGANLDDVSDDEPSPKTTQKSGKKEGDREKSEREYGFTRATLIDVS